MLHERNHPSLERETEVGGNMMNSQLVLYAVMHKGERGQFSKNHYLKWNDGLRYSARWLVPNMVKNASCSSFACWRLICACLVSAS
jgi:hypothetical protein